MIVFIDVSVQELCEHGRLFNYNRPDCTCGCKKVWGHGFVTRILDGCSVELKRFRCPQCQTVFTLRPSSFRPRFQNSIRVMFMGLVASLSTGRWARPVPRQRGRHWLRRLERFAAAHFPSEPILSLLQRLHEAGVFFLE